MSSVLQSHARRFALLVAVSLPWTGCEGAEDKCARLQREAAAAWGGYVAVLEKESAEAQRAHDGAKSKAEASEARLLADARKQADSLYEPKSSAWWRAVDAAQQTLCTKDAECLEQKAAIRGADEKLKDVGARLTAARAAASAATAAASNVESAPDAQRAAEAVQEDLDRPGFRPSLAASGAAREACQGLGR